MAPCNDGKRAHSCSFPKWINHVPPNSILNQKKNERGEIAWEYSCFFPAVALLTESIWNWSFDTKVNRKYNSLEVVIFLRRFFFSFGYYCCGCCWCVMGSKLRVAVFMIMDFPFSPQEFRLCDMPDCFPQNGRYIFANAKLYECSLVQRTSISKFVILFRCFTYQSRHSELMHIHSMNMLGVYIKNSVSFHSIIRFRLSKCL